MGKADRSEGLRRLLALGLGLSVAACAPPTGFSSATPSGTPEQSTFIPTPSMSTEPSTGAISDRPGVPTDLNDRYWYTPWGFAGPVSSTLQIKVPEGENILAVGGGYLVSSTESSSDEGTMTTLVVRSFADGLTTRTIETDLMRLQGIIVGTRLFYAGLSGNGVAAGGASFVDGGIWTTELANAEDDVSNILPAGEDIREFGSTAERAPIAGSQTGATLMSRVGGFDGTRTDVIDVATLSVRSQLKANVLAITDDAAMAFAFDTREIEGLDLNSGNVLWSKKSDATGLLELESTFGLQGGIAVGYHRVQDGADQAVVAIFDANSGASREVYVEAYDNSLHLAPPLSTSVHLAMMPTFWDAAVQEGMPVSLIAIETGVLSRDAFRIEPE